MTRWLAAICLGMGVLLGGCADEDLRVVTPSPTVTVDASPTATPRPLYRPRAYAPGAAPMRIPPPSIAAAEAEGPIWLGRHASKAVAPPAFFEGVSGTEDYRCIEAGDGRTRSRDVVLDTSDWAALALELLPAQPSPSGVTLRAIQLDGSGATHLVEDARHPQWNARGESAYTTYLVLPEPGRWLLVVTVAPTTVERPQWGCFILDAPQAPGGFYPRSVAEAEGQGTRYASSPPTEVLTGAFTKAREPGSTSEYGEIAGSSERKCVDVDGLWDARSGEFVMRPAAQYVSEWRADLPGSKVLFIPLHQPERIPQDQGTLRLAATLLDDPRHTYAYFDGFGGYTFDEARRFEADYIASFVLPRAGRWLVTASDERANWGCFLLDLR